MAHDTDFEQASGLRVEVKVSSDVEARKLVELSRTVRALRKSRNWSQETLAKKSHVHRNTIYRLETSPAFVTVKALGRVADALETPAWKLLRFVDANVATAA